MKVREREAARRLRYRGCSMNEICQRLKVSKSSVSTWVQDIQLTPSQQLQLSQKGLKKEAIEKRRATRLYHENHRRQLVIDKAKSEVSTLMNNKLFVAGVALYWAEGSKTKRGVVQFANTDPRMIKIMMQFFKKICGVAKTKFRGYLHIHPHCDYKNAEKYWSSISGIPLNQFYNTHRVQSKASKKKRKTLPNGTFSIYICNTELFLRIHGWITALGEVQF